MLVDNVTAQIGLYRGHRGMSHHLSRCCDLCHCTRVPATIGLKVFRRTQYRYMYHLKAAGQMQEQVCGVAP